MKERRKGVILRYYKGFCLFVFILKRYWKSGNILTYLKKKGVLFSEINILFGGSLISFQILIRY